MKYIVTIVFLCNMLIGCSNSESYQQGQIMADNTYGSMPPEQMMSQIEGILKEVQSELEKADNKQDWWRGFCDRGEEIWLDRIDQINASMGQQILNPNKITSMFGQMRTSYRE